MNRYNAIIIDDEDNVRQTLEILIKQVCPEIHLCGSANSAESGRRLLSSNDIQLIFLDISMPRENGFEFLGSIPRENYAIIFTTAYEEYALKAIKANAIDYLLKPIDPDELQEAVKKAVTYLKMRKQTVDVRKVYAESLENLLSQVGDSRQQIRKITIMEKFGFRILDVNTIRYLEADSNYTIIHVSGLEKIISSKTIGEFEKVLDPSTFFRVHKSTIINMNYLKGFSSLQGNYAIMDDNTSLQISRRRFLEFREIIGLHSKTLD
jgi:two-component system LytT family response regulator